MRNFFVIIGACFCISQGLLGQMTSVELAAYAEAALQRADFIQALALYQEASKLNPDHAEYRQRCLILKNVIQIRSRLEQEQDTQKWVYMAVSLRTFYMQNKIYAEALKISQQIYDKSPTPSAMFMLGEAQLSCAQYTQAKEFLSQAKEDSPMLQVLLGVASAKAKDNAKANAIAENLRKVSDISNPQFFYHAAVLEVLLGNSELALNFLGQALEKTLPSRLPAMQKAILEHPDLQSIQNIPRFTQVLQTQSKVAESGCSAGSSCGSCPRRSGCGGKK